MGYCIKALPVLAFCMVLTFVLAACGGGGGGAPKTSGASTLTAQSAADIINCPYGGVALDYGIDDNKNGVLDSGEVDGTEYICNGTEGATGPQGPAGVDGTDGATGPQGTDGLTALVATSPADTANCLAGGTMIEIGIDANSNDVLDPGEIDPSLTSYICNGTGGSASGNTAPVADAGPDQTVITGHPVSLDGGGSYDAEGSITTYAWSFVMRPVGSTAVLNDTSAESPFFTPDVKGAYVLSLSVGDGRLFSAPDYVTITPKSWTGAMVIDANAGSAVSSQVAFDASGNAFAIWRQWDGTYYNVSANRYDALSGAWGTAEIINSGTYSADFPQVAVDAAGNAIAVWQQSDDSADTTHSIYANRYDALSGSWEGAEIINSGDGSDAIDPRVAVDADGNAIAVWHQWVDTTYRAFASRYDAGTGSWSTASIMDAGTGLSDTPDIAFDASGKAVAVWYQYISPNFSIYANRYDALSGSWGVAEIIAASDGISNIPHDPRVDVDADGNAIAVWLQPGLSARRYDAGTGSWGTTEVIDAGTGSVDSPLVAFDADGNAITVWRQSFGSINHIYANRYDKQAGAWEGAEIIEEGANSADFPQLAVAADGNAFAVWVQRDGDDAYNSIYASRYDALLGYWSTAEIIDADANGAGSPQVAVDSSGNAFAVWEQWYVTQFNIYVNRFE